MRNGFVIVGAVVVLAAATGIGWDTLAQLVQWAKSQLQGQFSQGVVVGAVGVIVLQTLLRGRDW